MWFVLFLLASCTISGLYGQGPEHQNWHGEHMCRPTSADVIGPYYFPDAPFRRHICDHDPSLSRLPVLLVVGRILDDRCMPLTRAKIEVWQADHDGEYLMSANCRAHFFSGRSGQYAFLTIHPGKYTVDGEFRPSHVHFRVVMQGYDILVTQMYFAGDSNLGRNDSCTACSSDRADLVVEPERMCADASGHFCFNMVHFDLTLRPGHGVNVVPDIDDTEAELIPKVLRG